MILFTYLIKMVGQIYTDIADQLILNVDLQLSVPGNSNVQETDDIYIIVDNELLNGAKIEIEYEIMAYALNGIAGLTITDFVADTGLGFDPKEKLLTEDKTNEELGWTTCEEGVETSFSPDENGGNMPSGLSKKIVLSKIISNNDENAYVNTARCSTASYGVGQSSATIFRRDVQSEYVIIIPPTGKNYIVFGIVTVLVGLILIIFFISKKRKAKKLF